MDAVTYGFERMIGEAAARANLPRDRGALQARLAEIGQLIAAKLAEPQALDDMERFCKAYRWPRDRYDLPARIEQARGILSGEASRLSGWCRRVVAMG